MLKNLAKIIIRIIIDPYLLFKIFSILKKNGVKSLFLSFQKNLLISNLTANGISRFSEQIKFIHKDSVIIFTHSIGGGADIYIKSRINDDLIAKFNVFIIKYIQSLDTLYRVLRKEVIFLI
jgi:hypothetical protein